MRRHALHAMLATVFVAGAAAAASAQVCLGIDQTRDTLTDSQRTAALMLAARQFEIEGRAAATSGCDVTYQLSHITLGRAIYVTMTGPEGSREATALGLEDLPAVYSQMVRSLLTGQPMGSFGVVDRGNVTAVQDQPPRRLQSDGFWYARLGYGGIFSDRTYGSPALGFGYRAEFDRIGVDVSFFNYQFDSGRGYYGGRHGSAGSLLRLQGLYFLSPVANRSAYLGAGLSWGGVSFGSGTEWWNGDGLQGELTAGYEIARATTVRLFLQADAVFPFYNAISETFVYSTPPVGGRYVPPVVTTRERYAPSLVLSVGVGWQRHNRSRHRP